MIVIYSSCLFCFSHPLNHERFWTHDILSACFLWSVKQSDTATAMLPRSSALGVPGT